MLSSKANAALMRVKEIETKYKLKRKEQKWNREQESDSPISSVSISPSEKLFAEAKQPLKNSARTKLEIKIPSTQFEEDAEETNNFRKDSLDAINSKLKENETDKSKLDAAISSENKSSPFIDKQESFNSTVTSIQENSSIKDDNSSKSFSKTSQQNLSKLSQYEENSTGKYGKSKKSDKLSKSTKEAQSSDNSSNLERSRESEKSKKKQASKIHFDSQNSEKREIEQEMFVKLPEMTSSDWNSKRSHRSEFSRNNSIIEESIISTIENVSEIKSEMSPVDETIANKMEKNSINVSKYFEHTVMVTQNASTSDSSSSKLLIDSQYANDTFENISSSPMRSNSELRNEKPIDEGKKIRDSGQTKKGNTSRKDVSRRSSETLIVDATKSKDKNSSEIITSVQQDGDREDYGKASKRETTKESTTDVGELPAMMSDDEDETVSGKSSSSEEESEPEENEHVLEKNADSQIHETMRKLHRDVIDALAKKQHVPKTRPRKTSKSSTKSKSETRGVTKIRRKARKEEKTRRSSEKDETANSDNGYERSTKRRKKRPKVTADVKSTDARDNIEHRRGKDKALNLSGKQMLRLRKRIVELRLREERESLRKYMNELRNSRPESDSSQTYFCPLEFPNIAGFTEPDAIDLESSIDQRAVLQERVLAIRRWMKDQYILYRDYCNMARAINTDYTPTTLEDAKETIRDLRKTTIKAR